MGAAQRYEVIAMKSELPFNRAASVLVSAVLLCANTSSVANAEETTSAKTTGTTEETTSAAVSSDEEETEKNETEWYKAELGDYDDSLSLISYEASPEAENSGEKKNKNKNRSV